MMNINPKYVTGQHLKTLEIYTKGKKFNQELLEKKGEQYGILATWIFKVMAFALENLRGD